jgi:hypothetical protein
MDASDFVVGQVAIQVKDYRSGVFERLRHLRTPEALDVEVPLQNMSGEALWIVATPGRFALEDHYLLIDFSEPESDHDTDHHFMLPKFQRMDPKSETRIHLSIPRNLRTAVHASKLGLTYREVDLLKEKIEGVLVRLAVSNQPISPSLAPSHALAALREWRTNDVRAPVAVKIEEALGR